jgi:hypothetical protein
LLLFYWRTVPKLHIITSSCLRRCHQHFSDNRKICFSRVLAGWGTRLKKVPIEKKKGDLFSLHHCSSSASARITTLSY